MRFRQELMAMSADIEAMFNQVAVPEDLYPQSVLRFVWRRTPENKVDVYQYVRHIFGAKCSPTCSNYALRRTAQDNKDSLPLEAEVVERNLYMDDLFKSVPSLLEACSLQAEPVNLLSLGGFRLTKWISNDKDLLNAIPAELQAQSVRTIGEEGPLPTERALGVIWDFQKDALLFQITPKELADTRWKVISLIASVFDPIGLLAPFIVWAKIFLQSLWKLRQGWEEKVPEEIQQEWSVWQKELQSLAGFSVPIASISIALLWFLPPPFSCTCLVIQVRKHSALLHTFDLSIQVDRDSALL